MAWVLNARLPSQLVEKIRDHADELCVLVRCDFCSEKCLLSTREPVVRANERFCYHLCRSGTLSVAVSDSRKAFLAPVDTCDPRHTLDVQGVYEWARTPIWLSCGDRLFSNFSPQMQMVREFTRLDQRPICACCLRRRKMLRRAIRGWVRDLYH